MLAVMTVLAALDAGCGPALQTQPNVQVNQVNQVNVNVTPAASARVRVRMNCDGPCMAIERSCDTGCSHMGYDPTPGQDQQHCRDECSDNFSDCLRDCQGS